MKRWFAVLLIALCLPTVAMSATIKFTPGTVAEGENELIVLGDGIFELADEPINGFQYPAIQPFDVQVDAADGGGEGGAVPVVFTLLRGATADNRVNLIFGNDDQPSNLLLWFDVPGLVRGDPIPLPVTDADGIVRWNAPSLAPPSGSSDTLAGSFQGGMLTLVPEPTSASMILIALTMLAGIVRRRQTA